MVNRNKNIFSTIHFCLQNDFFNIVFLLTTISVYMNCIWYISEY